MRELLYSRRAERATDCGARQDLPSQLLLEIEQQTQGSTVVVRDPKSTVRYIGFQSLSDGSRRFDFSFARADASVQMISVKAPGSLFSGPDHMALQECAGICYETLKSRVIGASGSVPASIKLTSADIAEHRKPTKTPGRRPNR